MAHDVTVCNPLAFNHSAPELLTGADQKGFMSCPATATDTGRGWQHGLRVQNIQPKRRAEVHQILNTHASRDTKNLNQTNWREHSIEMRAEV